MSSKPVSNPSLQARLETIQKKLQSQEQKLTRSRRMTTAVGLLALVIASGYFIYGYRQFSEVLAAQKLVAVAQDLVDRNLPTARVALEKQINASAETWAADMSRQAQDGMPSARVKLEDYVVGQVDEALGEMELIQDEQFQVFLRDKHDVLQDAFKELAASPQLGEQTLQSIQDALEEQLQRNMDAQAADLFGTVVNLNLKLNRLRAGKNLTPDEMLERRVLMLASRLKLDREHAAAKTDETARND